jgi:hypothetical protein
MGKNKKIIPPFVLPKKIKKDLYECPKCQDLFGIVEEKEVEFEAEFDLEDPTIH